MIVSRVDIVGFRNFVEESISLNQKTLVIGTNDSGKTNFLYACI